jgi:hypothetical protein
MDIFLRFPEYVDYSVVFKNPAVVCAATALKRRIAHFKKKNWWRRRTPRSGGFWTRADIDDIDDYF